MIESIKREGVTLEGYGAAEGGINRADMQVKLLGSSPCAFTLPFGSHQLLFESPSNWVWPSSTDVKEIVVTEKPQQITHIMSRYSVSESATGSEMSNLLPMMIEITGWTIALLGGLDVAMYDKTTGYMMGGSSTLLIGGAAVLAGGLLYDGGSTTIRSRSAVTIRNLVEY